jgi:hypothetical protein
VSGTTLTIHPNAVISASASFSFTFSLVASCTADLTLQTIPVQATLTDSATTIAGPPTVVTVTLSSTPVLPSVTANALDFGTLTWRESGYPIVQRGLTLTVSGPDGGCFRIADSWAIQIGSIGLSGPGGATVPGSSFIYLGPGGTVPAGMSAVGGPLGLSPTSMTVAQGDGSVASGSELTLELQLAPPSSAPPGVYTGTITIDVVQAGS